MAVLHIGCLGFSRLWAEEAPLSHVEEESDLSLALNFPTTDRLIDRDLGVFFTHRFALPAREGSREAYGLDGYAFVGLGAAGAMPRIPINWIVYRTSDQKTLCLALQARLWTRSNLRLAARLERYDETIPSASDPLGSRGLVGTAFILPMDWKLPGDLRFRLVAAYISRTTRARSVGNLGLGLDWNPSDKSSFSMEFVPRPGRSESNFRPGYALGYGYRTSYHRFQLLATNLQGTTLHQVFGGDYATGPRSTRNWSLGFNLTRVF